MAWWTWVVFGLALLAGEMTTPGGFYLLFFGIGAVLVGLTVATGVVSELWQEWLIFTLLSVISLLVFRKKLLHKFTHSAESKSVDSFVGDIALASNVLEPNQVGKVEYRGTTWNARNVGMSSLHKGQRCVVERVDGLQLSVRAE